MTFKEKEEIKKEIVNDLSKKIDKYIDNYLIDFKRKNQLQLKKIEERYDNSFKMYSDLKEIKDEVINEINYFHKNKFNKEDLESIKLILLKDEEFITEISNKVLEGIL